MPLAFLGLHPVFGLSLSNCFLPTVGHKFGLQTEEGGGSGIGECDLQTEELRGVERQWEELEIGRGEGGVLQHESVTQPQGR